MQLRTICTGVAAVLVCLAAWSAARGAEEPVKYDGPQRVQDMRGRTYEGEIERQGDKFIIRSTKFKGMTITLRKSEILRIDPLPKAEAATPRAAEAAAIDTARALLSDEEIAALLDGINVTSESLGLRADLGAEITVDESSVAEMMRIAGAGAEAKRLETDHFVFVYTSNLSLARQLAARLEAVYSWNVKLMKQLGLTYRQPEHKLETYFFGTHDEFSRYMNTLGMGDSIGILGFYVRDLNRSAFFDMYTWPPIKQRTEQAEDPNTPYRDKQRLRNETRRWIEWKNFEVVQHEAAHHIHFNIGVFSRERDAQGRIPRWTTEGLATMFELPETAAGASMGGTNHMRVYEFRQFFGRDGSGLPDMKNFLLDDSVFLSGGGRFYPLGWALTHYMWNKKREAYGKWLHLLAELGDRDEFTRTDRQQAFEDLFGKIDEKFEKDFIAYIETIHLKQSILPPDIMGG